MKKSVTYIAVVSLFASIITVSGQMTDDECAEIGFSRHTLKCSSCDVLPKFELNTMEDGCQQCCIEDNELEVSGKKYPKALLEVCWCKFPSMPQIEAFVKGEGAKKFPNLTVKHVNGAPPIIKMMNNDGKVDQTLSISKWDTDTIEEFLRTHLE